MKTLTQRHRDTEAQRRFLTQRRKEAKAQRGFLTQRHRDTKSQSVWSRISASSASLRFIFLFMSLLLMAGVTAAQDTIVPDLTGLSVPAAAALLNRNGLALGAENNIGWTAESGLAENRINGQSVPAGTSAQTGAAVDVTVLRSPNVILIYDENDFTLVNQTGGELNLAGLTFSALDGNSASFAATRWSGSLRPGQCTQVWSVGRNGPKGLDECESIQNWLVTTNPGEHFWTGGATQFSVAQNGVQRVICPVANPGRCEFYVSSSATGGDSTPFVYFAYTVDRLAVINTATDQWMGLAGFSVFNFNPAVSVQGAGVALGDPTLYVPVNPVASVGRLAPGQCVLFTNSSPEQETPPQPCDVIAVLNINPSLIFWAAAFELDSQSDGQRRSCPAATPGRLTLCVMPR